MAWRIVQQPNGKFARFSDIVDDFTHYDMSQADAVYLCRHDHEMSQAEAEIKVANALSNPQRFDEAIETIRFHHGSLLADVRKSVLSSVEIEKTGCLKPAQSTL
jgi:hypothetical protein